MNIKKARNSYNRANEKASIEASETFAEDIKKISDCARLTNIQKQNTNHHMNTLKNYDNTYTKDAEETVKKLLDTHFPNNKPDNEGQEPVRITPGNHNNALINKIVSLKNIKKAIRRFSPYKKSGPDNIYPCMLQYAIDEVAPILQEIYKFSMKTGYIPKKMLQIKVIFLPKPGKASYKEASSYRSISLMSFLLKTMERLIAEHMKPIIDNLHMSQYAYRKNRSTVQAIHDLVSAIEEQLRKKQSKTSTPVAWSGFCDIQGAFDRISFEVIKQALEKKNLENCIINWIMNVLKYRVVIADCIEKQLRIMCNFGTPQGGLISCLLWIICVDELIEKMEKSPGVRCFVYSDDVAFVVSGMNEQQIREFFISALKILENWCNEKGLKINPEKCTFIRFTKKHKKQDPNTKFFNHEIFFSDSVKYLGVVLDKRLNWYEHVKYLKDKCNKYYWMIQKFIGRTWGMSVRMSKWAYDSIILPKICYASCVWAHRLKVKSFENEINKIHNNMLRAVTKCLASTPILAMEAALDVLRIKDELYLRATFDILRLAKLKQWKVDDRKYGHYDLNETLNIADLLTKYDDIAETEKTSSIEIETPTLENYINNEIDKQDHIIAYTDASVMENRTGVGVTCETLNIHYAGYANCHMSSYAAEAMAIIIFLTMIVNRGIENALIAIFCDNKSIVEKLSQQLVTSHTIFMIHKMARMLENKGCRISVIWVPSHRIEDNVHLNGNNKADELTRDENARYSFVLEKRKIPKSELKRKLRAEARMRNLNSWPSEELKISREFKMPEYARGNKNMLELPRRDFAAIMALITGQNCLAARTYRVRVNEGITSGCRFCKEGREDSTHIIQSCTHFTDARIKVYNAATVDLKDLRLDIAKIRRFINISGIKDHLLMWSKNI